MWHCLSPTQITMLCFLCPEEKELGRQIEKVLLNTELRNQEHFGLAESHLPDEVEVLFQHHVWSNYCLVTENKAELLMYSLMSCRAVPAGGEGAGLYPCVCGEALTKPGFAGRTSHI